MKLDCYSSGTPLSEVPRLAADAEGIGFAGIWFTESRRNPFMACALAALNTEHMALGTDIAVAFPRSPMIAAQAAWDLAEASRGRFILGLGTQVKAHIERRFSTPFSHPGPRIREYVLAVRAIFRAFQGHERLRFEGDYYSFSLLTDFFSAGPIAEPDVPIYLAGVNPGMARIAGEVCDGFHVHPLHSQRYLDEVLLPGRASGAAAAGRNPSDITMCVPVFIVTGETDEERTASRESIRRQIAFYGSTRTYAAVFELHGWGDMPGRLHGLQASGEHDAMASAVTDEMLATFAIDVPWDQLAAALRERYLGRADRLLPYLLAGDWTDSPERSERWQAVATELQHA
jgi:probable F420-dependent oxidoreductase